LQLEELQAALDTSQSMCDKINSALEVECARKAALVPLFEQHGLPLPDAPAAEETPNLTSALETQAGASKSPSPDERVATREAWAQKQAEGRCKLATARAERAHCQAMEAVLQEKGVPLPKKPESTAA
jgi:hypothetical protein